MGFKAVIFDMDGVLIDSEYLYLTGIHRELQKKTALGPGGGLIPVRGDGQRQKPGVDAPGGKRAT